LPIETKIIV